ncbi:MAG: bifunctional hydroxymethylpyrimidine kinase/phosphomethylpyrimidine kinase [Alistipes sp.]|nr:bifunctional hydroxymethylpyrimidine kinase/phosphomethylpyrimidine kinase [Alistipes sp.]
MRLIVITRPDFFDEEALWIEALLTAGVDTLHLRKPSSTPQQVERLIKAIPQHYHSRIVLHDHFQLAQRYSLQGIHLNGRNPQAPDGYCGAVSRSCHTLEEVKRYKNDCSYLFLSPIFDSISKQGYNSAFTKETIREAATDGIIDGKVIALGGISTENISDVKLWGFGGAALLGDIWSCQTIEQATAKVKQIKNTTTMKLTTPAKVLSIAGSDPSGGAGIQADIKAITALGGYATTAITALTIQNTMGVESVFAAPSKVVADQIRIVMEDIEPQAIKIGMVNDAKIVRVISFALNKYTPRYVVYDPVMVSTSGHRLIEDDTVEFIERELIPLTTLLTPNMHEAEVLWRKKILSTEDMKQAAEELHQKYNTAILIKGGHLEGDLMCDILCDAQGALHIFEEQKIDTRNLHGTGCTLSSAIATLLARGLPLHSAIAQAKRYVTQAISEGSNKAIGHGHGPLWHMAGR